MKIWLINRGWWSDAQEQSLQREYKEEILAALKSQEKRPLPPLDHLISDVYETTPKHLLAQFDQLLDHVGKYPNHYPAGDAYQQFGEKPLMQAT
jgi:2-oxoisovalerate dehydrogenase E1 component alpha subunit